LKNCSLQAVCTKPIQQGKSPKYAEKGLKCIKPKNTNDMLVSIDDIDWIDSSTKDQIQNRNSDMVILSLHVQAQEQLVGHRFIAIAKKHIRMTIFLLFALTRLIVTIFAHF
jgi:hypothetical protein